MSIGKGREPAIGVLAGPGVGVGAACDIEVTSTSSNAVRIDVFLMEISISEISPKSNPKMHCGKELRGSVISTREQPVAQRPHPTRNLR